MKDYYKIFNLPCDASEEEIGQAYRRLVRQTHPDVATPEEAKKFIEVQEAWETLGCPRRRSQYDKQLRRHRSAVCPEPISPVRRSARPAGGWFDERPSWPLSGLGMWLSETVPDLELILEPAEASQGCEATIEVPCVSRCPHCHGFGRRWLSICPSCGGRGVTLGSRPIQLQIPPGVRYPVDLEIPLSRFGLPDNWYVVRLSRAKQDERAPGFM